MGTRRGLVLLLLVTLAGCRMLRPSAPMHPQNPPGSWHTVQPGETLAQIAGRADIPLEDLLEINGLGPSDRVEPGRVIYVLDAKALRGPPAIEPSLPMDDAPVDLSTVRAIFRWPLTAPKLTSSYGMRQGRVHEGIDLGAPTGTPIHAAAGGRVLYTGDAVRGYGNMVVLQHADDLVTVYAHNSVVLVREGDHVGAGQEIARVGQSGKATAPHLHFEVRRGQVPQNPIRFLPRASHVSR